MGPQGLLRPQLRRRRWATSRWRRIAAAAARAAALVAAAEVAAEAAVLGPAPAAAVDAAAARAPPQAVAVAAHLQAAEACAPVAARLEQPGPPPQGRAATCPRLDRAAVEPTWRHHAAADEATPVRRPCREAIQAAPDVQRSAAHHQDRTPQRRAIAQVNDRLNPSRRRNGTAVATCEPIRRAPCRRGARPLDRTLDRPLAISTGRALRARLPEPPMIEPCGPRAISTPGSRSPGNQGLPVGMHSRRERAQAIRAPAPATVHVNCLITVVAR